jgi:hypothetical protein
MEWYKQDLDGLRKKFKEGMAEYYRDTDNGGKKYYEENKPRMIEYSREKYKKLRYIKVDCGCGSTIIKHGWKTHCRTKKHQKYISQ